MARWPHAPPHWTIGSGAYFITASTLHKSPILDSPAKLEEFQELMVGMFEEFELSPRSWAIFNNHYHLIVATSTEPNRLAEYLHRLHNRSSTRFNRADNQPGRKVWFQYRDTRLTFEKSYLARLAYVNRNPVKHGLVDDPLKYRWCSAAWLKQNASRSFWATVMSLNTDRVIVEDDY